MAGYAERWQSTFPWWLVPPRQLVLEAGAGLIALGALMAAIAAAGPFPLSWRGVMGAGLCYAMLALLVIGGLGRHAPHRHFGLANSVTLCRAAFNAVLLAIAGEELFGGPLELGHNLRWGLTIGAATALAMDGFDGWAARRGGMTSEFGARFDMETDALFIMALALVIAGAGIVGPWVLASGLAYYVFRLATYAWPALAAPLPPSWRRKAICVAQAALLIAALAPAMPSWGAFLCCLTGLTLLLYSFSVDLAWLIRNRRRTPSLPLA
jgi:phosphatidylglycerophosphate synthase